MRTIQMTLDDDLVNSVDKLVKKLKTTRSAFTRNVLRKALEKQNIKFLEQKHQQGYKNIPVEKNEFSLWESEQEWCDQ